MVDLRQHPDGKGLTFPCELELMAFGPADPGFAARIEGLLVEAGAQRTADPLRVRQSSAGHYYSVHVPLKLQSRAEMERYYALLRAQPDVKYCL